jgi:pyroglutamyl-peptidase
MKMLLFLLLFPLISWPKSTVLISHFDAFGGAPFNASEKVTKRLSEAFQDHKEINLKTCALSTVFDKSFLELDTCLRDLESTPHLVLGLGEFGCELKLESWGRNFDKTEGPDNEGNERTGTKIFPSAPDILGLTYPLPQMYCALSQEERTSVKVSNNAGSFVCNNLAFQFTHAYEEIPFGFIHVPSHNCWFTERKINHAVKILKKMIEGSLKSANSARLPVERKELEVLRQEGPKNTCLREFYFRLDKIFEKGPVRFSSLK